ncbi:hypothetical protein M0R45_031836 [Rubus argutus]|uniref:P-loop containing nucleoside triphosphate hydrolase, leucine-rich repeat domain, L n=1 Tax=Rubus argutus TaxID=59490 RepID=A0AAW1WJC9_RUBAR
MADALISFVIDQLASTAFEQIKENVRLVLDVEKEVEQLTKSLKKIHAVLKDAEKRQVKEAVVQEWLDELTEVAYEMDNALDEWNTEALKQQIEEQEDGGENVLANKKKVRFSIPSPSSCFCFGQVSHRIVVRHDIAQTIKQLNVKLTSIAEERLRYQFQSTTTSGIEEPQPKTSSLVDVSTIFGREHEKSTLISMLLGHSTSTGEEEREPLVILVVGMGGMGKTTLAQLAYNDKNVKDHFEKSIWICVSDPFDEIQIAKAIIGGDGTSISNEMDALMQSVVKSVEGKRLLLVLDDVWTEDGRKWEQLKLALMSSAKGSRILVTTRKETIARMMGATTYMIHLEKLSEQNCSSLFYHIAFFDREKDKTDLFETIGNKIIKKCNGLPLAAKTLGSLMRYKNTPEEWHDILNSEMWELEVVEEKVFRPLLLSYHDLTSKIKPCLLLCASFPKDYQFEKDKLIELWMSQNYLNLKRNKVDKRAIGREYFDSLIMRSFFQDFQMDDYGKVRSCKMHDIVHDFVQFLTRNECFIIEANQAIERLSSDSVYHLSLMSAANPLSLPTPFHTCKKLRSLATFNNSGGTTRIDGVLILQLKCLRALNLSRSNVNEVSKEIGELLHLRYIDLSYNYKLKELPDTMCNLCNLETLNLEWCLRLEKLPKAMGKLINLKHLYLEYCWELRGLPKGVGRLRGLRILDRFVCGGGDDKEILELGDLGSFEHLQGTTLSIVGLGNVKDAREQAQKAQLETKKHLLKLELDFGRNSGGRSSSQRISDEEVLDALRPHPDLKSLWVFFYEGSTLVFGNWIMSLQHLTHLTLWDFEYCESLPPLGKLPYLEGLYIDTMCVKKVGVELLGIEETQTSPATATPTAIAFPKLKQLIFRRMDNWEEWEGVGDDCQVTILPCLSSLEIQLVPKLKQLPDFLLHNRPQLQLEMEDVHPSLLEDLARRGKAVSSIPEELRLHLPHNRPQLQFEGYTAPNLARRGKAVSSIG